MQSRALRSSDISALQRAVLRHYRRHKRDLPWRRTRNPYRILVSEIMLQQTQVQRVIPKYRSFLRRFPSLQALARAPLADVLRAWIGLGYNGRALRLWRCARTIVSDHAGRFPRTAAALRRLPGIGSYTAAALASFAFGEHTAAVDINVRRVLARALTGKDAAGGRLVAGLAAVALPGSGSAEWTQALMDVGALFCRATPRCEGCPARNRCRYARKPGDRRLTALRPPAPPAARPRFAGSNRYYRGRIVRILATVPSISTLRLAGQVKPGFGVSDRPWLHAVLQGLQRDGLVRISRGAKRVSLP